MIDDILAALVTAMYGDAALSTIQSYHKVEGMVPGFEASCSVWVPKQKFKEYTRDSDEAEVEIHILVSVQDFDAESGASSVRALAEEIRLLLTADDMTLGGLIDSSFLSEWDFAFLVANETEALHLGEAVWQVTYYAPRYRPITPVETDEVDTQESIDSGS